MIVGGEQAGPPGGTTVTVAESCPTPPDPWQEMIYIVVVAGLTLCAPWVAVEEVQAAEQETAFSARQRRVLVAPAVMVLGEVVKVTETGAPTQAFGGDSCGLIRAGRIACAV